MFFDRSVTARSNCGLAFVFNKGVMEGGVLAERHRQRAASNAENRRDRATSQVIGNQPTGRSAGATQGDWVIAGIAKMANMAKMKTAERLSGKGSAVLLHQLIQAGF